MSASTSAGGRAAWRLAPRSLFGRNLLLIAALIAVALAAVGFAFVHFVSQARAEPVLAYARQYAETVALALDRLPPAERAAYALALGRSGPAQVLLAAPGTAAAAPAFDRPARSGVARWMRSGCARLPAHYTCGWQESGQLLWLGLPAAGGQVWVGFPASRLLPQLQRVALVALAGGGLLALGGAALVQRRIDRPLRALVAAAGSVGAGRPPPPLPTDGPLEIARLAQAFNAMTLDLQRLDRERALMLAGVSHDLRTPLAKIRLALELIGPQADPQLRAAIERGVDGANRVIDQFIDFAHAGLDEPHEPVDLNAVASAVAAELGSPTTPVALAPGAVPRLRLPPRAVRRMMMNLVDNAHRHAGGTATLATGAAGGRAWFAVRDRGPGIPAARSDEARQPFARLDPGRGPQPGAGLGLAIVDRLARSCGATLELGRADGPPERPGLEARVLFDAPLS